MVLVLWHIQHGDGVPEHIFGLPVHPQLGHDTPQPPESSWVVGEHLDQPTELLKALLVELAVM